MPIDIPALANESIRNLTPYQPGKPIEELERELGITSSIKLASNENPLGASPQAINAANKALANTHIYPDGGGFELKDTLSNFLNIQPDQITLGNGSENILELIAKTFLSANCNAVISEYAFMVIPILIKSYGAGLKVAPATNWGHDANAMLDAIDDNTKIVFIVNPNNPTGTYLSRQAFETLINGTPNDTIIVVDEAYSEYIDLPDYPNALDYINHHPNMIVSRTFSKAYGLAALRLGFAVSSPDIADMLNRSRLTFNVNAIAAKAGCAAIADQAHVQQSILVNNEGRAQLEAGLDKLGLSFIPSLGNFITINVGDAGATYQALLKKGVIIRPLSGYNMPEFIRVSIGTKNENERFLQAMEAYLAIRV